MWGIFPYLAKSHLLFNLASSISGWISRAYHCHYRSTGISVSLTNRPPPPISLIFQRYTDYQSKQTLSGYWNWLRSHTSSTLSSRSYPICQSHRELFTNPLDLSIAFLGIGRWSQTTIRCSIDSWSSHARHSIHLQAIHKHSPKFTHIISWISIDMRMNFNREMEERKRKEYRFFSSSTDAKYSEGERERKKKEAIYFFFFFCFVSKLSLV